MQKKQAKYVIALWFVVVLIFSILPGMAFSAEVSEETELSTEEWDVSRSKTATELNELFESQVTLSLPSAESNWYRCGFGFGQIYQHRLGKSSTEYTGGFEISN